MATEPPSPPRQPRRHARGVHLEKIHWDCNGPYMKMETCTGPAGPGRTGRARPGGPGRPGNFKQERFSISKTCFNISGPGRPGPDSFKHNIRFFQFSVLGHFRAGPGPARPRPAGPGPAGAIVPFPCNSPMVFPRRTSASPAGSAKLGHNSVERNSGAASTAPPSSPGNPLRELLQRRQRERGETSSPAVSSPAPASASADGAASLSSD